MSTKLLLKSVSYLGLLLSIVPALFVFRGELPVSSYYWLMVIGMLLWFGTAIFWVKPDHLGE